MKDDYKDMGIRIATLRKSKKMTQEVLAEKLNVSTKHISHVERGCASLSLKNLIEISHIFNCSLDYIVLGSPFDKAFSRLPETILEILYSNNEEDIALLIRYLEIYSELFKRN